MFLLLGIAVLMQVWSSHQSTHSSSTTENQSLETFVLNDLSMPACTHVVNTYLLRDFYEFLSSEVKTESFLCVCVCVVIFIGVLL